MEEEGINDEMMHPLSGLFENCYNATAIDENYTVVKELLKEWSITSLIYMWVCVRGAVEAIPSLSAAIIGCIIDVCKNRYYFYGTVVCTLLLVLSLYWLVVLSPTREQKYMYQLRACYKDLHAMIDRNNWQPLMLRLAWSDAVSYDCMVASWPHCGGVNGSIRFDFNLDRPANAGLSKAIDFLKPLHYRYPIISWADLIQMAGVVSIKACGGPTIPLVYGRWDAPMQLVDPRVTTQELLQKATNTRQRQLACSIATSHIRSFEYPSAVPPFPGGAPSADVHLRAVFYRLGFNNRETVALCGAHTIGRAFSDRSGVCAHSSGDQGASPYTKSSAIARFDQRAGVGMPGGCSWTHNWLHFDNEYFQRVVRMIDRREEEQQRSNRPTIAVAIPHGSCPLSSDTPLLWLPMDAALFECPEYRPYFIQYARSLEDFYRDYSAAHIKMSELGAKFRYKLTLETTDNE